MSDEVVVPRELLRLAIEVSMDAPLRPNQSYSARVRWSTVNALRVQLEAAGIDWRKHHPQNKPK